MSRLARAWVVALLGSVGALVVSCASPELRAPAPPAPPAPAAPPAPPAGETSPPSTSAGGGDAGQADGSADELAGRVPDIEYVPTPQTVVDRLLSAASIKKDDVLYDL